MGIRTKNIARNMIWGVLEKIITIMVPFLSRTVMIKVLGAQYLGLNSLFTSILSVLSLSELGFGTAIAFSMYKPIAQKDNATVCALLNLFRRIYSVVGIIVSTLGIAIMPFIEKLIKGNPPDDVNVYILYGITLFNTVISYFMFSYKAVLFTAHQRNDVISKIAMTLNLFSSLVQIILLITFENYYLYIIVTPCVTIITNLMNCYLSKKMYPELVCYGDVPKELIDSIKKRVIGLLSFKIYGVIFSSVDTIIISAFLGLVPLAKYNNYHYIQTAIIGFIIIFTNSITASVGNKMVTASIDDNYKDMNVLALINAWIVNWCTICLVCLYQPFMVIWLGDEFLLPFSTMLLMSLQFMFSRISVMTFTYREAAGLWWEDRFRPIIATIVNLIINFSLVEKMGINGVVISTIFCTLVINIPWGAYVLFKKYFKRSPLEYFLKILFYIGSGAAAGILTYICCSFITTNNFLSFIIRSIICIIVPNVILFLLFYKRPEFHFVIGKLKFYLEKYIRK